MPSRHARVRRYTNVKSLSAQYTAIVTWQNGQSNRVGGDLQAYDDPLLIWGSRRVTTAKPSLQSRLQWSTEATNVRLLFQALHVHVYVWLSSPLRALPDLPQNYPLHAAPCVQAVVRLRPLGGTTAGGRHNQRATSSTRVRPAMSIPRHTTQANYTGSV